MTEVSEKAAYSPPILVELGTFEQITEHASKGSVFDGTFITHHGEPIAGHIS